MSRTLVVFFIVLTGLTSSCGVRFDFVTAESLAMFTATLSAPNGAIINTDRSNFQLVFSEKVSDITSSSFSVKGGSITQLSSNDGLTYDVEFLIEANTLEVLLEEKSVRAENGNYVAESNILKIRKDTIAPSVSISSTAPSATNLSSIPIAISFSEEVPRLELSDFTLSNATATSLSQASGSVYTLNLLPGADGVVSVQLNGEKVRDLAGNANAASNTLTFTVDRTGPTVGLSTTESSPSNSDSFSATAIFNEQVTGFLLSDLSATNATLSGLATSDNTSFTFTVTPSSAGTVSIDVASSVATDLAGNGNSAATTLTLIHTDCPNGYLLVPGNPAVGTANDFCVMQYEARAWSDSNTNGEVDPGEVDSDGCSGSCFGFDSWVLGTHTPISRPEQQPWRLVEMQKAFDSCRLLNTESSAGDINSDANNDGTYALISNPEWITIARNVEMVATNWTEGSVGSGCLKQGNVGSSPACPGSGYNASTDPDSGTARSDGGTAQLQLSNGGIIWDFSGNLAEFVDWSPSPSLVTVTPSQKAYASSDGSPQFSWIELNSLDVNVAGGDEMPLNSFLPTDGSLTRANGIGGYFAGNSSGGGAAWRGGMYGNGSDAGAFALALIQAPSFEFRDLGFRCVYRPE